MPTCYSRVTGTTVIGRIEENDARETENRILIIDDARAIHEDFRKILRGGRDEAGELTEAEADLFGDVIARAQQKYFAFDSAYQGEEGLALVRRGLQQGLRYPMAFVDVRMPPGLDGIQTAEKLWALDPDLQIVVCTAHSDYTWEEMAEKLGQPDRLMILKKPFDPIEVLQMACALTEKWRLLREAREKMDRLDGLVLERTRHLQQANIRLEAEIAQRKRREECLALQHEVASALADSMATSEEVVSKILQIICQRMKWDVGELWTVDRQADALRCTSSCHPAGKEFVEFKNASQQVKYARGAGLVGRVWDNGHPAWIPDVANDEGFLRSREAAAVGLHAGFAFPLRLHGEVLGVIDFFSSEVREPEYDMLQVFTTLGSQIGQAIERKKLEAQLNQSRKLEAIGQLAGGIAHDFNNMICVIQGYAVILKMNEQLDTETREGLDEIAQAAQRAANLTNQLLTFSRKQIMRLKVIDLNAVATALSKMLGRLVGEDIALERSCGDGPALIKADEDMMGQVLLNLAINARDAMPRGGKLSINIELVEIKESRSKEVERSGEFVCLTVADSGCGIPPEILPRIFEPFFTTKGVGQGTGLGLSTVHGIVAQHHGWIEVVSHLGVGTTFRIFLPQARGHAGGDKENAAIAKLPCGSETILLVEDEEMVRKLSSGLLQRLGYRVVTASSGVEALSIWEEHREEVVLLMTDMVMPGGINGRDLAQRLLARNPGLKVIFTSGYSPNQSSHHNNLFDGINFLQKPYDLNKLARTIRRCLDAVPLLEG